MDTKGKKILIADDEPDILEILQYNLANEGYQVITAKDGDEAIEKAKAFHPELIVLDIMMPKKNGIEVCNILRMQPAFMETLIIFLTALSDEKNQIHGLETGADDYISKPISPKVLISRVNALFRRTRHGSLSGKDAMNLIQVGDLLIDKEKFMVNYQAKDITLAKKVFLRNEILSQVWGTDVIVGDRTIDVHIRKIRQKLEVDCITTVKGVGYKFEL